LRWPLFFGLLLIVGWVMPTSVVEQPTVCTKAELVGDHPDLGSLPALPGDFTVAEAEAEVEEEPVETFSSQCAPSAHAPEVSPLAPATVAASVVHPSSWHTGLSPRLSCGPPPLLRHA